MASLIFDFIPLLSRVVRHHQYQVCFVLTVKFLESNQVLKVVKWYNFDYFKEKIQNFFLRNTLLYDNYTLYLKVPKYS
jgi:ABC-type polysaccharide transport system permease subunit